MGMTAFSDQFRKIKLHKRIGYDLNIMQQSACLVINPITVDNCASLFNYTPVDPLGGSIEYPGSMFREKIRKIMMYPAVNPIFTPLTRQVILLST